MKAIIVVLLAFLPTLNTAGPMVSVSVTCMSTVNGVSRPGTGSLPRVTREDSVHGARHPMVLHITSSNCVPFNLI